MITAGFLAPISRVAFGFTTMSLLTNGVLTQCLDVDLEYERPTQDFHEFRPIHADPVISSSGDGNFCLLGKSVNAMLARPVDENSMFLGLNEIII